MTRLQNEHTTETGQLENQYHHSQFAPNLDETFFLAGLAPSFFLELQLTKVSRSISSQPECLAYQGTVSFAGF
jgi:hypothetical protein